MYTFILVLFSTELFYSIKGFTQVLISLLCFPIGFIYFDNQSKLDRLHKVFFAILIYSLFSSIVGYKFGIGKNFDYDKTQDETIGLLGSSGLYSGALIIGLLPIILPSFRNYFWRVALVVTSLVVYVFILLNVRRTAIMIPIVGLLTFAWFSPNKSKIVGGILFGASVLILASPFYFNKLVERYEVRAEKGRFNEDFYKTENRYEENIYLFNTVFSFDNPLRSMVGHKIYASGRFDDARTRMYHSDPANLLAGTGIIGTVLYILIYVAFFRFPRFVKGYNNKNIKMYKTSYYVLLFISLFVSLNGSLMLVSLRSIIFLYLGAMLSLMYREKRLFEST